MERSQGGATMQPVKASVVEKLYSTGSGARAFQPPRTPVNIVLRNAQVADDQRLGGRQKQVGAMAHAMVKSCIRIEAVAKALHQLPLDSDSKVLLLPLIDQLRGDAVTPLSHGLRMAASQFNDLGYRRRNLTLDALTDPGAKAEIKAMPLGFDVLFTGDTDQVIDRANRRQEQKLLTEALASRRPAERPRQQQQQKASYNKKPAAADEQGQGHQQTFKSPHPYNRGAQTQRGASARGRSTYRRGAGYKR